MNYTLRKAASSDLKLSFEIRRDAMMKYIEDAKGWDEEKEMSQHIMDFDTDVMKIIETDGKAIGVVESIDEEGSINVHGLYILKDFQNYKIGSRVMKEIIDTADKKKNL